MAHQDGAVAPITRRSRAPFLGDLRILLLGIWGFVRQCLLTCGRTGETANSEKRA
jgi:hypothetical protein